MKTSIVSRLFVLVLTSQPMLVCGQATLAAQRPKPAAAKPPTPTTAAAPALPQIRLAGIRVVGAGLGANGSELHAFNESSGTTIALAIHAAAGVGIVEIDDHASRLDSFADDRGQSLLEEGRFGPFPKLTGDGSAGLIEIEVKAHPSAGAASLVARGSLALTLSSGSKPQRIANVRLETGRTLKLGSATVALKQVSADGESTAITFGLSRSLVKTLRDVRFFDAKGGALESRRTGSGYINDAATIDLDVKTREPVVAVEFEVWQNLRQTNVPFEISAGLGLPASATAVAASTPARDVPRPVETRQSTPASAPSIAPAATDGAGSAAAVMKQMQTAAAAGKARDLLAVVYPDDRANFVRGVAMIMPFAVMAHLDDEKAADTAKKGVDALFAKHKVTAPLISEPAEIFKSTDLTAFLTDALAFLKGQFPKAQDFSGAVPLAGGAFQDLKVTGDSASAKIGEDDVTFTRVNGRWFTRVPATRAGK
jgi:hypothetical protein